MGLRAELVEHLRTELGDGIFVYDVGAEVIAVPAVVLTFGNPATVVSNFGGHQGLTTALNVVAVSQASDPTRAADEIEDLCYLIRQAMRKFPIGNQYTTSVGFGDRAEVGGVQYPTGTVEVLVKDRDRGATIP